MMLTETGGAVGTVATNTIVASLLEMASGVLTFIQDNTLMFTMFCGSLVGVACYVVRRVKKTSKA